MKLWESYINLVKRNCAGPGTVKNLPYWRNHLFAGLMTYLLPLCLIALLPALYWVFITGQYAIAITDFLAVAAICVVAFLPGITQPARKIIFVSCIYVFGCLMLYHIGLPGPGLIYLLTACIISILIFQSPYKFWPAWLNTFICILFFLAISSGIIAQPEDRYHSLGEWVAVTTNLIFLSFLLAALIPWLFNGLQETIDQEKQLADELGKQERSLQNALLMLQQKNKELEQFAYVASHDLKEPLRMVTSFMGLLKNKYGDQLDEKAHTYINFSIDGGKRMQKMIEDLLELSRTARNSEVKELANLDDIFKDVKQNIFQLIKESHAEIITTTALPVLAVYKTGFTRLLQNLLSNAIKFRKKETDPLIHVSATEKEEEWLFCIQDNGIGIEAGKFEKIFEIFTRLHSQEDYKGTGIGLAICRKTVEHHGGRIWVDSEEKKGSSFYFTIKK